MVFFQFSCTVNQESGSPKLCGHLCNLKLNGLKLCDRCVKLFPFLCILNRSLISALCDTKSLCCDTDSSAIQGGHGDFKALSLFAQKIFLWNLHVIEQELCGCRGTNAHLVIMVAEGEAFPALFHDKSTDSLCADSWSGNCKYNVNISFTAVGDKDFFSIQKIIIPAELRRGLCASGIGAGIGFRQTERTDLLPFGQRNQIFLFLLFRTVGKNRIGSQRNVSG